MNLMNLISILGLWQTANREYFTASDGTTTVAKVTEGSVNFYSIKQPNETFTVNVIELPTQLVVIDFGFIPADSVKAYNFAKSLNKPMAACVLTHYHPDHFGGFEAWKEVCPQLLTFQETIDLIQKAFTNPGIVPQSNSAANAVLTAAKAVQPGMVIFDNVEFVFDKVLGVETEFFLFVRMPKQQAAFAGDIITNKGHHYIPENHDLSVWFKFLTKFRYEYRYRNVFVGHGFPVDWSKNENYKENIDYLNFVRNVASTYKDKDTYVSTILNKYPDFVSPIVVPFPYN